MVPESFQIELRFKAIVKIVSFFDSFLVGMVLYSLQHQRLMNFHFKAIICFVLLKLALEFLLKYRITQHEVACVSWAIFVSS